MTADTGTAKKCGIAAAAAAVAILLLCLRPFPAAAETLTLMLTSNLEGRFAVESADNDDDDPLLVLARGMIAERRRTKVDLYLDLGNAFYPGVLSKYSSGSIMMDYLDFFSCDATLVSSRDLRIGVDALEFLGRGRKTRLLSGTIARDGRTLYAPYITARADGVPVAVVGISSKRIRFDIAEKNLYGVTALGGREALGAVLREVKAAGITRVILLSGMRLSETIEMMAAYREIGLAVCGGDNTGELYSGKASRVDLADGRTIIMTGESRGYYLLGLAVDGGITVRSAVFHKAVPRKVDSNAYREFVQRLALWKKKFREEEDRVIATVRGKERTLDDARLAGVMRDRFNAEVAVVEKNTLNRASLKNDIRRSDLLRTVNQDFNIFTFRLRGKNIEKISWGDEGLVLSGLEEYRVQGYALEEARRYRFVATQPAFEKVQKLLGGEQEYANTWVTVNDLLLEDLKGDKTALKDDYRYLDRRFRMTVDVYLSNFIDNAAVHQDENIEAPVDQPGISYLEWGMENRIDITFYNRYHRLVLTPYMLYTRHEDEYLQNLLRGTLLYNYNLSDLLKPYHKSQCDTVVKETDRRRPVLIRETVGFLSTFKYATAKLGVGFEKQVHEPVDIPLYGIEAIAGVKAPFFKYFKYSFDLDTFISIKGMREDRWRIRSGIDNALSASVNRYLSVSLKYKWFYLYNDEYRQYYRNSQLITSVDLKTDFKVW